MKWIFLLACILFEVGGTTMLKFAGLGGGHEWKWGLAAAASYAVCFGDEMSALKVVSFLLNIAGIVALNLSGILH
ncbi:MAG: multidrug transporter EmrE-like cation transporter [Verrucomicrobiales bacterium]|jgi:multidrug transporter EmrE-like cation transporter